MNIMDFVDSIKLQLSDLEKVGEIGYVEGISSIITSNLKALDVTQRPVHCTDKKREVVYVKDEDKWEKDDDQKKIRKAIKRVASKNSRGASRLWQSVFSLLRSI
jgi:PHD/YefM family antitoxin component YafN of YafNO toxin-antitoxin module